MRVNLQVQTPTPLCGFPMEMIGVQTFAPAIFFFGVKGRNCLAVENEGLERR